MAFWTKWFARDPEAATRAEYEQLRAQAAKAPLPSDRARLLNLAGDLALNVRDERAALASLGEALDIYLRDRDYHSARAVARKLLRVRSSTVRVRSTLAWLAIAQDLPADARVALDLYVGSLAADAERSHAVRHLAAMAQATDDTGLRETVAEHLASLEAHDQAAAIRSRLEAEADGTVAPPSDAEIKARWRDALNELVSPDR